ncbi:MAG: hypothetical protein ACTHJ7_10540 [Candidatus Nitrosocosmicus sp.]
MSKELVRYELSLPTVFDLPLRRFCLFHQADFERLPDEQKQKLIASWDDYKNKIITCHIK